MTIKELVSALRISSEAAKMTNSITWSTLMENAAFAIESLQNDFDRAMDYVKKWEAIANETKDLLLKEHEKVPKWVSCSEILPLGGSQVLICLKYPDGSKEVSLGEYWDKAEGIEHGWGGFGGNGVVTHWTYLPNPPMEGK